MHVSTSHLKYMRTHKLTLNVAQMVKNLPAMQETRIQSLGRKDPLEKGMATHSSTPAWRIPRTEEPGGLQSVGWQRVGHDWATNTTRVHDMLLLVAFSFWLSITTIYWVLFFFFFFAQETVLGRYCGATVISNPGFLPLGSSHRKRWLDDKANDLIEETQRRKWL